MTAYTIDQIERAINIWRARHSSGPDDFSLCAPVRALATPYALLIMSHRPVIDECELTADQLDALRGALRDELGPTLETPTCTNINLTM